MIKNSIVLVPFPFDDLSDSKVRKYNHVGSKVKKRQN
jgi:hypothetical protein